MLDELYAEPSLKDRAVIVTGGTRGLGWAMTSALLKAGAKVIATGVRAPNHVKQVERQALEIAGPGKLFYVKADVRNWEDCQRVINTALDTFGGFQVLINNAGRGPKEIDPNFVKEPPKFWNASVDAWRMLVDINLNGAFYMAKAAAPHFLERDFGKIIGISTSQSTMVRPGFSPYGPTKAALETATLNWSKDLEGTGVTANILLPGGPVDTDFVPMLGTVGARSGKGGFMLHPDVMIAPALYLSSDLSNGVTGKRYIGKEWDTARPIAEAEARSRQKSHDEPVIM